MDDLYILDTDKEKLKESFGLIRNELNKIKLEINSKSGIYKLKEGVSFLGYMYLLKNNKLIIKYTNDTIRKIDRKLKKNCERDFNFYYKSLNSYKGYFINSNTRLFERKYKNMIINNRYDKYRLLKKYYFEYVVFIKYKGRYYTYGEDLLYLKKFIKIKYNYIDINKIVNKIEKYIILDGNEIRIKH